MVDYLKNLPKEEQLVLELSQLYEHFGYKKYCMGKFEEYSFYSDNRDFLNGEGVIAFNNSDGRLMALKPDITLSIVKNVKLHKDCFTKTYYNENVYRISDESHDYKEIRQTGVELLGDIDEYSVAEIVLLALKSLQEIDADFILSISHMGYILSLLDGLSVPESYKKRILMLLDNKNMHDLKELLLSLNVEKKLIDVLSEITLLSGKADEVLPEMFKLCINSKMKDACEELESICNSIRGTVLYEKIRIDLSVVNASDYYNGIVFKGYVKNVPTMVLSGGRYDVLASKIRNGIGAIGFAVYLDNLNLFYRKIHKYDTDILIINKAVSAESKLLKAVSGFARDGYSVRVEKHNPENYRARTVYTYENGELKEEK